MFIQILNLRIVVRCTRSKYTRQLTLSCALVRTNCLYILISSHFLSPEFFFTTYLISLIYVDNNALVSFSKYYIFYLIRYIQLNIIHLKICFLKIPNPQTSSQHRPP